METLTNMRTFDTQEEVGTKWKSKKDIFGTSSFAAATSHTLEYGSSTYLFGDAKMPVVRVLGGGYSMKIP